ncbi:MAG: dienelactone hydrolase family protein, partial [bacterium]
MNQKFIDLYDAYLQEHLDRRDFFKRLTVLAGSVAAANAILLLLENSSARAEIVPKDDPRLESADITYPGATGQVQGYLAMPKGAAKLPGVVVIHENRGLNPHIEDVARRVALEGYLAIAPDALSPVDGTPDDPDKARDLIGKLDDKSTQENYFAAVTFLKTHPASTGKVGVIGFCWG